MRTTLIAGRFHFSVEAQRDFHMDKIKNLVKSSSRHVSYTTPAGISGRHDGAKTTAVAIAPPSPATVPPPTRAADATTATTEAAVRVLVAGKKFRPATTVTTPRAVATTTTPTTTWMTSTTSTWTTAVAPESQMPIRESILTSLRRPSPQRSSGF